MVKKENPQDKIKAQRVIRNIQTIITALAIELIIIHIIWPSLAIDSITLGLIVIAAIPWLFPFVNSIEFGDLKIGFKETNDIIKNIIDSGLVAEPKTMKAFGLAPQPKRVLQISSDKDPNLALAHLRLEIGEKLKDIAKNKNIAIGKMDSGQVLIALSKDGIFYNKEKVALQNLIEILDRAVHGADVDNKAAKDLMSTGETILNSLDALGIK